MLPNYKYKLLNSSAVSCFISFDDIQKSIYIVEKSDGLLDIPGRTQISMYPNR